MTTGITDRARKSLAIAFDEADDAKAEALAKRLAPYATIAKIGSVPFHGVGTPRMVQVAKDAGMAPWVDWKGHEIPNIMAKTTKTLIAHGVKYVTYHGIATPKALRAATSVIAELNSDMIALGVTILTSEDDADVAETYIDPTVEGMVKKLVTRIAQCGLGGMVSSPRELAWLGAWLAQIDDPVLRELVAKLLKVTPAIRPLWSVPNDQKRPTTPYDAILAGANIVVVGRPILEPPAEVGSCEHAAELVLCEIEEAHQELDRRRTA